MPDPKEWEILLGCSLAASLIAHSLSRIYWVACLTVCVVMVGFVVALTLLTYPLSMPLLANLPFVFPWGFILGGPMAVLVELPFAVVRGFRRVR